MVTQPVLVVGGTGPAGICLLRELLHRSHPTRVFARNPAKIPAELSSNPLLVVVKAEVTDIETLSAAVSGTSSIVSFLGPVAVFGTDPATYTTLYTALFRLMREHGVRRIFAMGTISTFRPEDSFSPVRLVHACLVSVLVNPWYRTARAIARVFEEEAGDLDYTVFRIAAIAGGCDEGSWGRDREDREAFEGWVGEGGWTTSMQRASLTRWLVDGVEGAKDGWIGKMPAVSRLAGSKRKDE